MSSPFYLQGSRSIRNLSEEETLSESDFEHMCPADGDEISEDVHSWYRRLSFTHRLAESIIHNIGPNSTVDELDIELISRMANFPYSARLAKVQSGNTPPGNDDSPSSRQSSFGRFLALIGVLDRRKNGRSSRDLATLMEGQNNEVTAGKRHMDRDEPTDPGTRIAGKGLFAPSITSNIASDVEVARYTTALKEYGDRTGHKALYDISFVTLDPPLFRAEVSVQGQTFGGIATTKRQAKHLASQRACESLSVRG
ncbi:hypothetical protein LTR91_010576 [Friedmanniomyces endolithicus]|uniref:DRBM domain-containing protein n=1 Tax=Friedmanniomyces endolithicus TaxID=329885 RepID=A0AAN6KJC1_9PEZI|nr:hypothetical protein LTR57_017558 [Friedmanniomyces endolithicus]KAK0950727.1 hypothetical protein LTS01_025504 [Friedmanniomyces endolithicus]KAK0985459.1 hypothetical protein LTR91_010576 [Friedmanniomyces endolithicus]KAK1041073.1 hypothetical protein LTS16_009838 [Friedmanniomyces endolithicus]